MYYLYVYWCSARKDVDNTITEFVVSGRADVADKVDTMVETQKADTVDMKETEKVDKVDTTIQEKEKVHKVDTMQETDKSAVPVATPAKQAFPSFKKTGSFDPAKL